MTAQTRLSAKGQVVIPKDVRERLGFAEGTVFDVIERGDEVVLKRSSNGSRGLTASEALKEIHAIYRYDGPPLSLADLREAARSQAVQDYLAKQKR